jgi:pSer/pThr/pTyr-binding forkhead associated (FHA) protein
MAVTVVVLSGGDAAYPGPSLTLDAPRLVIGRSEGCDVRLPEPTVSHRHASIRQRGGEYVLLDENSANGTFMDRVRLPPQTPRVLRSGERVRLGRVWLELRFEPAVVKGSTAAAAKELALALVAASLRAQGEDPDPRLTVLEGPGAGASLVLAEPGRTYAIGRAQGGDLVLDDPGIGRRHATVVRKADVLVVADCGAGGGTLLDGQAIQDASWRPGQVLAIGRARVGFTFPATEALAELERSPDERMADGEVPEPAPVARAEAPSAEATEATSAAQASGAEQAATTPSPSMTTAHRSSPPQGSSAPEPGGWGKLDAAVVIVALAVLGLSVLAAFWVFGR